MRTEIKTQNKSLNLTRPHETVRFENELRCDNSFELDYSFQGLPLGESVSIIVSGSLNGGVTVLDRFRASVTKRGVEDARRVIKLDGRMFDSFQLTPYFEGKNFAVNVAVKISGAGAPPLRGADSRPATANSGPRLN
jgi:hypothetical protein